MSTNTQFDLVGGSQTNNTAHKSGGSTAYYNYGDVVVDTTVVVDGVVFANNVGERSGAGLVLGVLGVTEEAGSVLTVSRCIFEGNVAELNGGGLFTDFTEDTSAAAAQVSAATGSASSDTCGDLGFRCVVLLSAITWRICAGTVWSGFRTLQWLELGRGRGKLIGSLQQSVYGALHVVYVWVVSHQTLESHANADYH